MRVNPILRGDLRARLMAPKAVAGTTLFLSVLAVLTILSLPPELGRRQDVSQQGLLEVFLIIQSVVVLYLASAMASGEITIEGEKAPWDLAASPFPVWLIARGKILSSTAFATVLIILGLPLTVAVAGIRGQPLSPIAAAAGVTIAMATALGGLGALYSTIFESDFTRSAMHWTTLLLLILGPTVGDGAWRFISPLHAVPAAISVDGVGIGISLSADLVLIAVGTAALAARIGAIRREARFA